MESPFVIDLRLTAIVSDFWLQVTAKEDGQCKRLQASQDTLDACYFVLHSLTNYTFSIVPADDDEQKEGKRQSGIGWHIQMVMQIMLHHAGMDRTMNVTVLSYGMRRVTEYLDLLKAEAAADWEQRKAEWRARIARQAEAS